MLYKSAHTNRFFIRRIADVFCCRESVFSGIAINCNNTFLGPVSTMCRYLPNTDNFIELKTWSLINIAIHDVFLKIYV